MGESWELEIEPEVRHWLDTLSARDYLQAEHAAERLLDAPTTLGEPYSRHLGDGLRELRFAVGHDGNAIRLTYWLARAAGLCCSPCSARRECVRTPRSSGPDWR
jgi:hypothetical protein